MHSRKISWRSCNGSSPDAWPELAYRAKGCQLSCLLESRGTLKAWLRRRRALRWRSRTDYPSQIGEEPILGEGVGQGGIKAPPHHAWASAGPPPPSPPQSCLANKWLHSSMGNLNLQPKPQESKSRTQEHDASLQKEEKPRKQVRFEVDEELGNEPDLPSDLILFLAEGTAPKQVMLPVHLPSCPLPPKAPSAPMSQQEGSSLKFWQQHPLVNPGKGD